MRSQDKLRGRRGGAGRGKGKMKMCRTRGPSPKFYCVSRGWSRGDYCDKKAKLLTELRGYSAWKTEAKGRHDQVFYELRAVTLHPSDLPSLGRPSPAQLSPPASVSLPSRARPTPPRLPVSLLSTAPSPPATPAPDPPQATVPVPLYRARLEVPLPDLPAAGSHPLLPPPLGSLSLSAAKEGWPHRPIQPLLAVPTATQTWPRAL